MSASPEEQEKLYTAAINSRDKNNTSPSDNDFGPYVLTGNNCGHWAETMLKNQGLQLPAGALSGNVFGVGLGGIGDYILDKNGSVKPGTTPSPTVPIIVIPFGGP